MCYARLTCVPTATDVHLYPISSLWPPFLLARKEKKSMYYCITFFFFARDTVQQYYYCDANVHSRRVRDRHRCMYPPAQY
jgi:hypothetical protein